MARLRIGALLGGWRGAKPADRDAVVDVVVRIGQLAVELGDRLAALDVNPVLVSPTGAVAVDVLVQPRTPLTPEWCEIPRVVRNIAPLAAGPHHSRGSGPLWEGKGDRVGGQPDSAVRVEAVEAEVGDVHDVGAAARATRSAAARATPGPHIIPWPPAAATTVPSTGAPSRSSGPRIGRWSGRVVDRRRPRAAQAEPGHRRVQLVDPRAHALVVAQSKSDGAPGASSGLLIPQSRPPSSPGRQ